MTIEIRVLTDDSKLIESIFETKSFPSIGESINIPGNARLINTTVTGHGIDTVTIINFVLQYSDEISVSLVASYLYDKLKGRNVRKITLNEEDVSLEIKLIEEAIQRIKEASKKSKDTDID